MDPREAIRQVLGTQPRPFVAVDEGVDEEEPIGELEVAEYIIFVLALDTYMRYVEETTGSEDPDDPVIRRGIKLLRIADGELDRVRAFLDDHLPSESHKRLLAKAVRRMGYSPAMAAQRALMLRTALSRGGAKTMRAVFETNRALREVRAAIAASMMDDADAALDLFAGLPMRNARLRAWIDLAARTAGSGETPQNPIEAGTKVVADQGPELLKQAAQEMGAPAAEDTKKAIEVQTARITQVQEDATQAAKKSMEASGEPDLPLIKSEVVGVAVAAATAAASDPSKPQNVPATLIDVANDPEQLAAALTDGRVLVAAGAGAGKSRTLTSRVSYLIQERGVDPSRVLVTSFNRVAANKLGKDIADRVGAATASLMTIGTMHSLFGQFIRDYGTPDEQLAMTAGRNGGQVGDGVVVARVVQKLWEACFNTKERPTPKLGDMMRQRDLWAGNDVSLEDSKGLATQDQTLQDAADWYEMYEGLKGAIPGWEPPCEEKVRDAAERKSRGRRRKDTPFERFMAKYRPGGRRLGDFNDMIKWCADIMERDPAARETLQRQFDHILIDECQDLNSTQHRAFRLMSEHIDESKGQSLWLVGDDKQAIYEFAGARPDLFISLYDKEGWNTRMIRTNYRSTPEIIESANRLIAHNTNQIPMEANPAPSRVRGTGSVKVIAPTDEAEAALSVVEAIKERAAEIPDERPPGEEADEKADGPKSFTPRQKFYSENAVLARTNAELHAYETACIIRGIPYARRGAGSFLGSPETSAFLGYVQLATGTDFGKMQKALGNVLHRPNRFWKDPKSGPKQVEQALREYAHREGLDLKTINPVEALANSRFQTVLTEAVLGRQRYGGKDFQYDKTVTEMGEIGLSLQMMRGSVREEGFTTEDLFNMVFELRGKTSKTDPETGDVRFTDQSFRESLEVELRDRSGDDADAAEEDEEQTKGMGNITFLYELMKVDPTDEDDMQNDPGLPMGFQAKMTRLAGRMRDLRTDFGKWAKKYPGENPPSVLLSTVHRVKGDQWETVFVQMPKNKFPIMRKPRPNDPPTDPEKEEQRIESERRLGYVALTRAKKNLTVVCPRIVGEKEAGISPFVEEAQLSLGENVSKPTTEETV